jgi:heterodisulfide reductase subunit C
VPKLGRETTRISRELLKRTLEAEKLKYCHQCGICTASCPWRLEESLEKVILYSPSNFIKLLTLAMRL